MALNEGVILSEDEIKTFVHPLKPDIKQSILQLQYILSTGEIVNVIFLKIVFTRNFFSIN